jgi:hypothetical protein
MRQDKMILTFLAACSLGLITTGCSTVKGITGNTSEDQVTISSDKMVDIEVSSKEIDQLQIPAWFIAKEEPNANTITVTATDISKDLQFAIDKATLSATVQLAQKLKLDVSSLVRESTLETGFGSKDVEKEMDRVSKSTTNQTVAYYRRENMKIVRDGDYYRAYVMLKLDIEEARRLTEKPNASNSREERLRELDQLSNTTNSITQTDVVTPVEVMRINPQ